MEARPRMAVLSSLMPSRPSPAASAALSETTSSAPYGLHRASIRLATLTVSPIAVRPVARP